MTIQEAMKKIFDEHKKPMAEWIRLTGLSRQQIYRWKKGDVDKARYFIKDIIGSINKK